MPIVWSLAPDAATAPSSTATGTTPSGLSRATAATTMPVNPSSVAMARGSRAFRVPLISMAPATPARAPDRARTDRILPLTLIPA